MISALGLFLWYDNNLRRAIIAFDVPYFLSFFALYGISYYLYLKTGANPGYVDLPADSEGDHIELTSILIDSTKFPLTKTFLVSNSGQNDGAESLLQPPTALNSNENIQLTPDGNLVKQHDEGKIQPRPKRKENSWMPELRYCEHCKVHQPYRTKHCDKCERCVYKFDHHCFWMGQF